MSLFTHLTVRTGENAVEYVDGVFTRVLAPGRYRKPRRAEYRSVHTADRLELVSPQDVLTSDGVTVRVTAAVRWAVTDARTFLESSLDASGVVYLAVQIALREAIVDLDSEAVVRSLRRTVGGTLTAVAREAGAAVGIAVREVVVKDVILPIELRTAYAAQVAAKAHGQARLEAARAETAALRSLANGAKLLEDHPALARLRLVQSLPPGATVELTLPE
jgi:regulator of protease activity HflC (stomatin/prohibitin superfamily)